MKSPGLIWTTLGLGSLSLLTAWPLLQEQLWKQRGANESKAAARIKSMAAAEAVFRSNDLDRNGIPDFWTGDVAGLFRFGLIEREVALADLRPLVPLTPVPIPTGGYYYVALDVDDSVSPPLPYRQTTDPVSGRVHHLSRFGFMAIPARPGLTANAVVMINEENSLWAYRTGWSGRLAWPSDEERRMRCSRFG